MLSIHYRPPRTKATSLSLPAWPACIQPKIGGAACVATKRPQCRCQEVHLNRPSSPLQGKGCLFRCPSLITINCTFQLGLEVRTFTFCLYQKITGVCREGMWQGITPLLQLFPMFPPWNHPQHASCKRKMSNKGVITVLLPCWGRKCFCLKAQKSTAHRSPAFRCHTFIVEL